jgi:hypothetical protein
MSSRDMIVDRKLTPDEICEGISKALEISLSGVIAVDDIYRGSVPNSTRVLCHFQDVGGDFSQIISVYIRDSSVPDLSDEEVGIFSDICDCRCLVDSLDENPLAMTLVEGTKKTESVYLSSDVIDEDKYVIDKKR